ncbi:MAG TPA: hypothetical protein VFQ61_17895 [Polyangiaceae bacterium]|nr:hypothetical protein [Polyangiaceae bacterium]
MVADQMSVSNRTGLGVAASQFLDSMPLAYGRAFSTEEIEVHAQIVARRQRQLAHVEACPGSPAARPVCVVADDQPGLLSLVTDALLLHGLNVASARAYCRRRAAGEREAVDFFWLQPATSGEVEDLDPLVLEEFAATLRELLAENAVQAVSPTRFPVGIAPSPPLSRPPPTRVFFDVDALRREELLLVAQGRDFPGLLFAIASALHGQGVRIEASEIRTEAGWARDHFHLSLSSSAKVNSELLFDIQAAVLSAIAAARPGA